MKATISILAVILLSMGSSIADGKDLLEWEQIKDESTGSQDNCPFVKPPSDPFDKAYEYGIFLDGLKRDTYFNHQRYFIERYPVQIQFSLANVSVEFSKVGGKSYIIGEPQAHIYVRYLIDQHKSQNFTSDDSIRFWSTGIMLEKPFKIAGGTFNSASTLPNTNPVWGETKYAYSLWEHNSLNPKIDSNIKVIHDAVSDPNHEVIFKVADKKVILDANEKLALYSTISKWFDWYDSECFVSESQSDKTEDNQINNFKSRSLSDYSTLLFSRLNEVFHQRPDIRIVGDRFIFQSEVLFHSGTSELHANGQMKIDVLAKAIIELEPLIPSEYNWVLRVDGHTDINQLSGIGEFHDNWELSSARAISIVKGLITLGVSPNRLAASGFGEFQPLEIGESEEIFSRNRRIELSLIQK